MYLSKTITKNEIYYYACKGVRQGKTVKKVRIKAIGKHSDLILKHADPEKYAQSVIDKLQNDETELKKYLTVESKIKTLDDEDSDVSDTTSKNIGYLYLNSLFNELKLDDLFKEFTKNIKLKYKPIDVFRFLVLSRIINPQSKLKTYDGIKKMFGTHNIKLEQIYRTMDYISDNLFTFQKTLYNNSNNIIDRNTKILYYDCTNFFFETKEEDDLRKYGKSKENRPNPIVQLGLFMDTDGIPLAFNVFSGNENENTSVKPLEDKIIHDFKISNFIYCADAGLNSNNIRLFNSFNNRNYIVTQSLKKLKKEDLDLILTDDNWQSLKTGRLHSISTIKNNDRDIYYKVLYINNPIDVGIREKTKTNRTKKKTDFKQRLIVTYRKQYEIAQREARIAQINRAVKIIDKKSYDVQPAHNPKRLIKTETRNDLELDLEKIESEQKFDGYYASVTSLDCEVSEILKITTKRWQIEESFRIMKTNLKARPVYHYSPRRITSHFAICFTSLLIYRLLEHLLESRYTTDQIIAQLRNMQVSSTNGILYSSHYKSSRMLKDLEKIFDIGLDKTHYINTELNKKTFKNYKKGNFLTTK